MALAHAVQAGGPEELLDGLLAEARKHFGLPGVAAILMDSHGILARDMQGVRVAGQNTPISSGDFFHIGSCAKSVLATMAAQQVERGAIAWDTRLYARLPELAETGQPEYAQVTLMDLLASRGGIRSYTRPNEDPLPAFTGDIKERRLAFARHLVGQPPATERDQAGFRFLYSNAGYTLAVQMLERASGQSYETLVRGLLGDSVRIGWPTDLEPDQPWGHMLTEHGVEHFGPAHPYRMSDLLTPAGDLSLTADGFADYVRLHLRGARGEGNVVSAASYHRIHHAHDGFALAVENGRLLGRDYLAMDGSAGTFFARAILVPEADFAFVLLTNLGSGRGTVEGVEWLTRQILVRHFNLGWRDRMLLKLAW